MSFTYPRILLIKVAKDMIPADLAIVPFVSIKGNYITTSILRPGRASVFLDK